MASLEACRILLAKARQDEYVLAQFVGDAQAADQTFGFHAQQAAEKGGCICDVRSAIFIP